MKEPLKTYWNIALTIITLVVGWLVFPLSAKVDSNIERINDLRTRMAVQESMMLTMDKKLDEIKVSLDKVLDKIYE